MTREQARAKAEALVQRMSVEEAASQLRSDSPAIERLNIPAYNWWNEALHGVARAGTATSFPQAIALAACFDPDLIRELGDIAATEGRAKYNALSSHGDNGIFKGLTFWSPNVNIFRDPRWGRGHETYGEDPYLTATLGAAYVKGLQGEGDTMKAAACAKHFAVHSGPEAERHHFNALASIKDMEETYLPAFHALVNAGVEAVMGAYTRTNGEPCCAHTSLMKKLRDEWGFKGHFLSDSWAIHDFHMNHGITATEEESAALALNMGCDLNCGITYRKMMEAYKQGLVSEEQIRNSAVRLFTTRYLLGMIEGSELDSIPYSKVECTEHLQKADEAAHKCCVLLKNDGILPLKKSEFKTLGVIGPNANNRTSLIGNYHGTSSRYITVLEGLQDVLGDEARILYSEGSHLSKDRVEALGEADDRLAEAVIVAESSDVVVLVVGLDETLEGEAGDAGNAAASGDKADLLLPEGQRRMIEAVLKVGKPTVICLLAGSSIDLGKAADEANAVLLGWYPGARGGRAIADILLGNISPSGKLPVTFYRNEQLTCMPAFSDYSMRGRTYRYIEDEPLYPFGYGLTYGNCRVVSAERTKDGAYVDIVNEGHTDTEDVVQIYVQNEGSTFAPLNPRLCAYKRIRCPAGRPQRVFLKINAEQMKVVNNAGEHVFDGRIVYWAGFGQPDRRTEVLTRNKTLQF